MDVGLFDYELPPERIAQTAIEPRDAARLLCVDRATGVRRHRQVRDLVEELTPGDLLVVNDTKVVPARLFGRKPTGGLVQLLLLEPARPQPEQPTAEGELWHVLIGSPHAPRRGTTLQLADEFTATLVDDVGPGGRSTVAFLGPQPVPRWIETAGKLPLPPYIRRTAFDAQDEHDRQRYQTVYAGPPGALAAPTAGLHFTPQLLEALKQRGVTVASVTLHVGEGTFRPVRERSTGEIRLHPEWFRLPPETSLAIAACRARGRRVVAVGTTTVRVLESREIDHNGGPQPGMGSTTLFIAPGWKFRFVDALMTNFHLPQSTLLMLVAAFAGRELTLEAYAEAVREEYRFYSYGDAMLIQ